MRSFAIKHKYFLFLILIFIICEIIVNPIGEFPLNDDWAYSKSVSFALKGYFTIGGFGAMTLFTHLVWGTIFAKIFGFSFTILRISTLISSLIGLFFLNKLVIKISNNQWLAFFSCLLLLLNPLYFSLTNTYMTDVNFTTLLIMCCYFSFSFFETKHEKYIIWFLVFSIALVLIRQFGMVLPICFFFACLTLKEKRKRYLILSFSVIVVVLAVLKTYEAWLRHSLPPGAGYTFSGSIDLLSSDFWINFFTNISIRYKVILIHILLYAFPLAVIYIASIIKASNNALVTIVSIISICIIYLVLKDQKFPFHNMFTNMCIGPETFYERNGHTRSEEFQLICDLAKYIFCSLTFITLVLFLFKIKAEKKITFPEPIVLFLFCLMGMYIFMILVTQRDVYFDRYHLPLVAIAIILFTYLNKSFAVNYTLAVLPLMCFFYVSVFGTKDYLTLNRKRWDAFYFIKEKTHSPASKINGGFEINCWDDGNDNWWKNYDDLSKFDYLIQFNKQPGFSVIREYPFQRYFPYKKDTVRLMINHNALKLPVISGK